MTQFNLEEYIKNPSRKVVTREGRNVNRILCTDMKGDYQIVHDKPGEGRNVLSAILYRRDAQKKWTILITGPEKDKGKGYLQFDSNIWFYDPADKRFTFSSVRDKFQNTNANTSDFAPQLYDQDY